MSKSWKLLAEHPPCLIRLLARRKVSGKQVRAISAQEVAIASGLSLKRVQEISRETTWDSVTVSEAERFVLGCAFDPLNCHDRNKKKAYERTCKIQKNQQFSYLRKSPLWKSEFVPLINLLKPQRAY